MRVSNARWILLAALFLLGALVASAQTPDEFHIWTTVGSAGTLDETSEGKVFFDRGVVQKGDLLVIAPAGRRARVDGADGETDTAVIRYNVTAVDGLFFGDDTTMAIRFRAEGKAARVVARLIEVDVMTGVEVTRVTFDSDDFPMSAGYHKVEISACGRAQPFDFTQKAYYFEATLTTSSVVTESVAGIEVIQLWASKCNSFVGAPARR